MADSVADAIDLGPFTSAVLDAIPDPVAIAQPVHDPTGRVTDFLFIHANPAGRSDDDPVGRHLSQLAPGNQHRSMFATCLEVLQSGQTQTLPRFEHIDTSGRRRRHWVRVAPAGEGVCLFWRDITDEVQTRADLQASEERFRTLAENVTDVVYSVDSAGRITWISPSAQEVLGWSAEQLIGRPVHTLIHPSDLVVARARRRALRERGIARGSAELRYATAGGGWVWMSVSGRAQRDGAGRVIGGVESCRDISAEVAAREEAERSRAALTESEHRYRLLAENATDLVYRSGPDQLVRWVAPSVTQCLGWTPEELIGTKMADLVHPDDRASTNPMRARIYQGEMLAQALDIGIPVRMRTKSGEYRWMTGRVTGIDDLAGNPDGVVAGLRDVEDLVRAREVAEAAVRAERLTRMSIDSAAIGMAVTSPDGRFTSVNPALCRMLGYSAQQLKEMTFAEVTHPEDVAISQRLADELASGCAGPVSARKRYVAADGHIVWVDLSVSAVRAETGTLHHFIAQMVDVTAEVAGSEALQTTVRRFRLLAENASDVVYETDHDGVITWAAPSIRSVLGWDPDEVVGTKAIDLVVPEDVPRVNAERARVFAGHDGRVIMVRFRRADGGVRYMSGTGRPLPDEQGRVVGAIVGLRDVTEEELVRAELERSEHRLRLAIDGAPQGIAIAGPDGRLTRVNPALGEMLGADPGALVGTKFADLLHADEMPLARAATAVLTRGTCDTVKHEHHLRSGTVDLWVEHSVSLLRDPDGHPVLFVHQISDQTLAHNLREDLAYRANHDLHTGLANREFLIGQLHRLLATPERRAAERDTRLAVLYCDLDNLKPINDELGHAAGDEALRVTALRLSRSVRDHDIVARVGGDEFVVVLPRTRSRQDVRRIARKILRATDEPIPHSGGLISLTISIGIAVEEPHDTAETIMGRADRALYRAKLAGRNGIAMETAGPEGSP